MAIIELFIVVILSDLVNENSQHSSNYYNGNEAINTENEKLKLMLAHKQELIERQNSEIKTLKTLVQTLQNQLQNH